MNNAGKDRDLSEQDIWNNVITNVVSIIMSVALSLNRQRIGNRKLELYASELEQILTKFSQQILHETGKGCQCSSMTDNKSLKPKVVPNNSRTPSVQSTSKKEGCKAEKLNDEACPCDSPETSSDSIIICPKVKMEDKSTDVSCDCEEDKQVNYADVFPEINDDECFCEEEEEEEEKADNSETNTAEESCLCGPESNDNKLSNNISKQEHTPVVEETDTVGTDEKGFHEKDDKSDSKAEEGSKDVTEDPKVSLATEGDNTINDEETSKSSVEKDQRPKKVQIGATEEKILIVSAGPEGIDESVTIDANGKDSHKTILTVTIVDREKMDELLSDCSCMVSKEIKRIDNEILAVNEELTRKKSGNCNCSGSTPETVCFIPNFDLASKRVQTDVSCLAEANRCGCRSPHKVIRREEPRFDETRNYYEKLLPEPPVVHTLQVRVSSLLELTPNEIVLTAGNDYNEDEFYEEFERETGCICNEDDEDDCYDSEDEPPPYMTEKMTESFDEISCQIRQLQNFIINPSNRNESEASVCCGKSSQKVDAPRRRSQVSFQEDCCGGSGGGRAGGGGCCGGGGGCEKGGGKCGGRGGGGGCGGGCGKGGGRSGQEGGGGCCGGGSDREGAGAGGIGRKISKKEYCDWKKIWTNRLAAAEVGLEKLRSEICNFSQALEKGIDYEMDAKTTSKGSLRGCSQKSLSKLQQKPKVQTLICSEIGRSNRIEVDIPPVLLFSHH